jgi:hypothetical protein
MSETSPRPRPTPEYRIGERVPMPAPRLDIRPAFDGESKTSFKPARGPSRFNK